MKNIKIRFDSTIYKRMKNTASIGWLLTPEIKRYWNGKIIYIGLRGWNIVIDFRGINNINDFVSTLTNKH